MIRIAGRCRDVVRRSRVRTLSMSPAVEGLEDRKLLSTTNGGQWYFPNLITYSFVPDGTSIGGVPSNLYAKFDTLAPRVTWQAQFKKAAAIWQQVAGINLAEVPDNGDPVGGTGNQQGDPRYGDIRIGGNPMSMGTLAFAALPPPINGGSFAGDIVMNTAQSWQINNDYDLLTVAIHEFGHALGMGHSAITAADMYGTYLYMKQSLNTDDVSGIQGIYGAPKPDATPTNTVYTGAIDLTPLMDGFGRLSYGDGVVTGLSDFEWYKVTVPASTTGTMTVTMQSTGLSSLSPRLTVLTGSMQAYGQAVASNIYGATVTVTVTGVTPGQVYYIRAAAAQNGPGSNGAFGILVNTGPYYQPPVGPPPTAMAAMPDQGGGTAGEAAQPGPLETPETSGVIRGPRWGWRFRQGRNDASDGMGQQHETIKIGDQEVAVDVLRATPRSQRMARLAKYARYARFRHG